MIATSETDVLFNGKYYDKIDRVGMFLPQAQVIANLFMGFHEERRLEN